jgi:predicted metalloprotease
MRWRGQRQSSNVRDVRGSGGGFGGGFGGGMGGFGRGPIVVRRAGGGGIGLIIVVLIIAFLFGINPLELLSGGGISPGPSPQSGTGSVRTAGNDEMRDFVATVLADTEDTWKEIFARAGENYPEPTLTLYSDAVPSGCGMASAAVGPFYCPNDQNLYIDLSFFDELRSRFGAAGDFAEAYVIAHEVGHHVQNVLGILEKTQAAGKQAGAGGLSVRTELQADCFAGIWANHTKREGILEPGDIEEAMTAAAAVGDDNLQRQGQGYVVPDSFTHGTSEQRATWFRRGFDSGNVDSCDTFSADI